MTETRTVPVDEPMALPRPRDAAIDDGAVVVEPRRRRFWRFAPQRQFAGLPIPMVGVVIALFALAGWNVWLTHEVLALKRHRTVSVSIQRLVDDFVTSQSRAGGDPDRTAALTKLYLAATEGAVRDLTKGGTTVLVSEAVMANSVPDVTAQVQATVAARMQAAIAGIRAVPITPQLMPSAPAPAQPQGQEQGQAPATFRRTGSDSARHADRAA